MKRLLYILLLFPLLVSGQTVVNLSPDSTLYDLHKLPPDAVAPIVYLSSFYSDTIRVRWANPPTAGSDYDLGMDSTFYELDTITDGGAVLSVLRKADLQYFLGSHDSSDSKINTAIQGDLGGNFPLTYGVASLTWTDSSWVGDGTGYFTTGWDPTNESSQYVRDSAAIAVMTNQDDAAANVVEVGVNDGSNDAMVFVQWGGPIRGGRINSAQNTTDAGTDADIFLVEQRTGSFSSQETWVDGVMTNQESKFVDAMPDNDFYVFARNNGSDVGEAISSNEIFYVWVGFKLTATQIPNWNTVMQLFKLRLGYSKTL